MQLLSTVDLISTADKSWDCKQTLLLKNLRAIAETAEGLAAHNCSKYPPLHHDMCSHAEATLRSWNAKHQ
jgi:hypothetical protein